MDAFTLDQFTVFVAVVDHGGFAAAARALGRAQSAITYAVKGLEEQTGLTLFDRSKYRPVLTDAGRSLLPRARQIISDLDHFRRQAEGFARGIEASLTLVADVYVPIPAMTRALGKLNVAFPSVQMRIAVEPYTRTEALIREGHAQLGVFVSPSPQGFPELRTVHWMEQELVAVAASSHPLAAAAAPISEETLRAHMQLVWTPSATSPDSPDYGVNALDIWHLTDLGAMYQLLRAGIGWGALPSHLVVEDIATGRFVRLQPRSWHGSDHMTRYQTVIAWRKETVLGPAAQFLIEALRQESASARSTGKSD